jgi:hypothetical protein
VKITHEGKLVCAIKSDGPIFDRAMITFPTDGKSQFLIEIQEHKSLTLELAQVEQLLKNNATDDGKLELVYGKREFWIRVTGELEANENVVVLVPTRVEFLSLQTQGKLYAKFNSSQHWVQVRA